jgi:hypothetical protein
VNPVCMTIHNAINASLVDRLTEMAVHDTPRDPAAEPRFPTNLTTSLAAVFSVKVKAPLGQVVRLVNCQASSCPWLLPKWARLEFLASECEDNMLNHDNATESLKETMNYLFRGIPAPGSAMANRQIHGGPIECYLGKSIPVFTALIASVSLQISCYSSNPIASNADSVGVYSSTPCCSAAPM